MTLEPRHKSTQAADCFLDSRTMAKYRVALNWSKWFAGVKKPSWLSKPKWQRLTNYPMSQERRVKHAYLQCTNNSRPQPSEQLGALQGAKEPLKVPGAFKDPRKLMKIPLGPLKGPEGFQRLLKAFEWPEAPSNSFLFS